MSLYIFYCFFMSLFDLCLFMSSLVFWCLFLSLHVSLCPFMSSLVFSCLLLSFHNASWVFMPLNLILSLYVSLWLLLFFHVSFCLFVSLHVFVCLFMSSHVCWSVGPSVRLIVEFRVVFALLLLPNHPWLDCWVSGLFEIYPSSSETFLTSKTNPNPWRSSQMIKPLLALKKNSKPNTSCF